MRLNEMETTIKKVVQGKTVASTEAKHGRCKLIFDDLTFVEFYVGYREGRGANVLAVRWGKEKNENRTSN